MHYLIDGHNLIAQLADIELGDPNDEVKLVLLFRSWVAAGRNRQVTIYFDGGAPGGKSPELSHGRVQVVFAPSGAPADDLLINHVRRAAHPGSHTLVTGDRQILAWAKKQHMPVVTSEAFARRLEKEQHARREAQKPDEGSDPIVSSREVEEWLELFGPVPETPPPPASGRREEWPGPVEKPAAPRPPSHLKTSGDLTEEEISAWLDLFRSADEA